MGKRFESRRARRFANRSKRVAQAPPPVPPGTARQKVLVSVPTGDGLIQWSIAHAFAGAVMLNARPDFPFSFGTHVQAGTRPIEYARNLIVEAFLDQTDFDWLLMIDADQTVPPNFWQLCAVNNADIVSGLTHTWMGNDFAPGRLRVNQYSVTAEAKCFNIPMPDKMPEAPYFVPIVGTGCIAIRRHVFRPKEEGGLGRNPFYFTRAKNGNTIGGEDINFCVDAQRAGFKIAVHPGVKFGHIKMLDIAQVAEFYQARKEWDASGQEFTPEQLLSVSA